MNNRETESESEKQQDITAPDKVLSPVALRALAEAEERRRLIKLKPPPKEINGRDGPEPVRYGDWEKNGLASDF